MTSHNSLGGGIIALIVSVIGFVTCIAVIVIICVSVACTKKAKRRVRERQSAVGPVSYNPQAPMGGAVYMVPVDQIPPSGILLVPPQVSLVIMTAINYYYYYRPIKCNTSRLPLMRKRFFLLVLMKLLQPLTIIINDNNNNNSIFITPFPLSVNYNRYSFLSAAIL